MYRLGIDGLEGAVATRIGVLPAACKEPQGGAETGSGRKSNDARPKDWPAKDAARARAKAQGFKARAQAGAMLRLSRVMKNR
ncbi:hypothetical protein GCM10009416_01480 [Craurococcus roseus]|uniref:Uncharacterized protein n=1 Tax=Craurococcus roseus TaxID=77585 RepID=A0ABN1EJ63_9PROT